VKCTLSAKLTLPLCRLVLLVLLPW
jgi:hypothetical protein